MHHAARMSNVTLHVVREIRLQVSVVRTLLDEVDAVRPQEDGTREQLIEELSRLGCRLLETASAMSQKHS